MKKIFAFLLIAFLCLTSWAANPSFQEVTNVIGRLIGTNITVIDTIYSENTNEAYFSGAGTASVNAGKYVYSASPNANRFTYTNTVNANVFCMDLTGNAVNPEAVPYYVGPNTNNDVTAFYMNQMDPRSSLWDNVNNFTLSSFAGANPPPSMRFGTNTTFTTNVFFASSFSNYLGSLGKMIYVSTNGSDTAGSNGWAPFRSVSKAITFASAGSTVVLLPGVHNNCTNLLKNGVRVVIESGAVASYTAHAWDDETWLGTDRAGAVTSSITGAGTLQFISSANPGGGGLLFTNPSSQVTVKAIRFDPTHYRISPGATPTPYAFIPASAVTNCQRVELDIDETRSSIGGTSSLFVDYDESSATFGQLISVKAADCGYFWAQGENPITFKNITVTNGTGYSIIGSQFAFWSEAPSTLSATSDWHIQGLRVDGSAYLSDHSTNAGVWFDGQEFIAFPNAAAFYSYGAGRYYPNFHKVKGTAILNLSGNDAGATIWAEANKWQASGGWIIAGPAPAKNLRIHVLHFEEAGGSIIAGFDLGTSGPVGASGHDWKISGEDAKCTGPMVQVYGNFTNLTFNILSMETTGNNPVVLLQTNGFSGVRLKGCTLISPGTTNPIAGNAATGTLDTFWSAGNNTNSAKATFRVNAGYTVDVLAR